MTETIILEILKQKIMFNVNKTPNWQRCEVVVVYYVANERQKC